MRDGGAHGMTGQRATPKAARGGRGRAPALIPTGRRNGPMPPKRDRRGEGAPTGGRGERDLLLGIRTAMHVRGRHRRRHRMKPPIKPPRSRMARGHVRIAWGS
jgi:hypothetical protein